MSLQLWCLINELRFIQEVVRFYNWRWSRKGIHVLFHEVLLTVLMPPSFTPPLHLAFSPLHTGLTCSPISLERNAWVDSYFCYLCELDFFTCSACFLTSKIRIMSISVTTFGMWFSTTWIDMSNPHFKTTMIIISTSLFHRWKLHTVSINNLPKIPE